MIKRGDKVLVGVSGGPDSVALLLILNQLKKKLGIKIFVAHLNHGLRAEAKREELFVRKLSAKLALLVLAKRTKIKRAGSLEEDARRVRYDFFQQAAQISGANKIALAHTKDDQAETVLMRLLRGAGLSGLGAIPKARNLGPYKIIRPLMEVSKSDIIKFLNKRRQKYFIDKTNLEDVYFRNRVRNRLLPELEKYNKNIKELLSNTADNLSLDYEFLKIEAAKRLNSLIKRKTKSCIKLKLPDLRKEHVSIQRMIIRLSIERLIGGTRRLTYKHWQEIEALINDIPNGSIVNLPNSLSVKKIPSYITISVRNP